MAYSSTAHVHFLGNLSFGGSRRPSSNSKSLSNNPKTLFFGRRLTQSPNFGLPTSTVMNFFSNEFTSAGEPSRLIKPGKKISSLSTSRKPQCSTMATSPSSLLLPLGYASAKALSPDRQGLFCDKVRICCSNVKHVMRTSRSRMQKNELNSMKRRDFVGFVWGVSTIFLEPFNAIGAGLPPEQKPRLCDDTCEKEFENIPMVTTESGLQYKDIKAGQGPSPPIGFQVAANYVAMVPSGQIFDSSLEKGQPYLFRVGSGQVIKGLDEGILSMKVGGKQRLYILGPLAFPKGLVSAPGRSRVAANSPVIFDISLEYIPGLEDEDE